MIDVSNLSVGQLHVLKAVASFDCWGIQCEDCPFFTRDGGCGSMKLEKLFREVSKHESKN